MAEDLVSNDEISEVNSSESRLGLCEMCGDNDAKYSCPRCEIKTCSLACVKQHKADTNCSGERNKTAFKRVSEFTNLDLLSDYRMLEETTRSVENYKRDPLKYFTRHNRKLPLHLYRLQTAVSNRGSTLMFLPQHFSRHKNNTTFFNWSDQKIQWRVEWLFPQANFIKGIDERAFEDMRLSSLISKYLDPKTCPKEMQENLQFYQSVGLSGICLLLKAEGVRKSSSRFYELDPALTLKNALRNKCVMEFPIIYVVLVEHKNIFEIIESDEEPERDESIYSTNSTLGDSNRYPKKFQRKKQSKNLLFNNSDESNGSSDDDLHSRKRIQRRPTTSGLDFNIPDYHDLIRQND